MAVNKTKEPKVTRIRFKEKNINKVIVTKVNKKKDLTWIKIFVNDHFESKVLHSAIRNIVSDCYWEGNDESKVHFYFERALWFKSDENCNFS